MSDHGPATSTVSIRRLSFPFKNILLSPKRDKLSPSQSDRDIPSPSHSSAQQPSRRFQTITGDCLCCGSNLQYPAGIACFRCIVCSTINDLKLSTHTDSGNLSYQQLRSLASRCHTDSSNDIEIEAAWKPFVSAIARGFSSAAILNASFTNGKGVTIWEPGVSFFDVRQTFVLIDKLPQCVGTALLNAIESLLSRPRQPLKKAENIRFLMIILEYPVLWQKRWGTSGKTKSLLKRLFGTMSNLSNELHHHLVHWFCCAGYRDKDLFRKRVELVNGFISRRLSKYIYQKDMGAVRCYESDWRIRAAVKSMALLWAANLQSPRLGLFEFYNSMVDFVDLVSDYERWEQRSSKLSFCQYPFLLSVGSKLAILDFDAKRQMQNKAREAFFSTVLHRHPVDPYLVLEVRRTCVVEDSLRQISSHERDLKKGLRIDFLGEMGFDAGGPRKEWFSLLCRQVFDPNYGLFSWDEDANYCWFNPVSLENSEQFYLVGVVLGLAIYNSTILDVPLPLACYKKLLGFALKLEDLALIRPILARNLQVLLDYDGDDFESVFSLDFTVTATSFGCLTVKPLIPEGHKISVTLKNRQAYVQRLIAHILEDSVSRQFEPFKRGFHNVCGGNALSIFRPEEMELLIRGSQDGFDPGQLEAVAQYESFDSRPVSQDNAITWFWEIFREAETSFQRQILCFITGSDRIPAAGISNLCLHVSVLGEDTGRYPFAHTCFNQICIFRYSDKEKMRRLLIRAVTETDGFGLR